MASLNIEKARTLGYSPEEIDVFLKQHPEISTAAQPEQGYDTAPESVFQKEQKPYTLSDVFSAGTGAAKREWQGLKKEVSDVTPSGEKKPWSTVPGRVFRGAGHALGVPVASLAEAILSPVGKIASKVGGAGRPNQVKDKLADIISAHPEAAENVSAAMNITAGAPFAKALFGTAGAVTSKVGRGISKTGEKMMTSYLKPLQKNIRDGYDPKTIFNEGITGRNATEIAAKAEARIGELVGEQKRLINEGAEQGGVVHVEDAVDQAVAPILSDKTKYAKLFTGKIPKGAANLTGKARDAAMIRGTPFQTAVEKIRGMIYRITDGEPLIDVAKAQKIKQEIGELGAWAHDPLSKSEELSALEMVANKTYVELMTRIEAGTPPGLREINQRISKLIPVKNAAIRGASREEKNNIMGLNEMIGIGGSLATGNLGPLAIPLANKVLRNPRAAQSAFSLGELLQTVGKGKNIEQPVADLTRRSLPALMSERGSISFKPARDVVDGRKILNDVPNMGSISASLENYEIMPGIREIKIRDFEDSAKPRYYSVDQKERTLDLANKIKSSKTITPLIVVADSKGLYVLEGAHRFDALKEINAKSFPALVVKDLDDPLTLPELLSKGE